MKNTAHKKGAGATMAITGQGVKLREVEAFQEEKDFGTFWRLRLVYEYKDDVGDHVVVFPNVQLPFPSFHIPAISYGISSYGDTSATIESLPDPQLFNGRFEDAVERGVAEMSACFDIVTRYNVRQMTVEDIEKELGYRIKIVSGKENGNAEN